MTAASNENSPIAVPIALLTVTWKFVSSTWPPASQMREVCDDQRDVPHELAPRVADSVPSKRPNLRPVTVTDCRPTMRTLEPLWEDTGASKENHSSRVERRLTATTTSEVSFAPPKPRGPMHLRDVSEDHDDVKNGMETIAPIGVQSMIPKLSPVTVATALWSAGMLRGLLDTAGASKERGCTLVPTRVDAVTVGQEVAATVRSPPRMHVMTVADDQEVVPHESAFTAAVGVTFAPSNWAPRRVSKVDPDRGRLTGLILVTEGGSAAEGV